MLSFKPKNPKISFKENWIALPTKCQDVSGFQGHYKKHYVGVKLTKTLTNYTYI